jgi:predicted metal-binding membrane protein
MAASRAAIRAATGASLLPVLWVAIAVAWVVVVLAEATGTGALLHHHALIEGGPPLALAVPAFLLAWQVMVAGMMVPASLPAIGGFERAARKLGRPCPPLAGFMGAYLLAWTAFGLFAFSGDFVLHHVVDVTPWLAARPWLIEAGVVGLAGVYQFTPIKRRSLDACRHSITDASVTEGSAVRIGFAAGMEHAIDCLGASWALMLLMFAAGFANVWWMAALTAVMVYEARGRRGHLLATFTGAALLALALSALVGGGLPAWGAA